MNERDFKGVWIPKAIWCDNRLTAIEKVLLAEIDSFTGEQDCFASNEYLASFCGVSTRTVIRGIQKLIEIGYVEKTGFNGQVRTLRSRCDKMSLQKCQNVTADMTKCHTININNNSIINSDINGHSEAKKRSEDKQSMKDAFECIWKDYPRKVDKSRAFHAFQTAIRNGVDMQTIKDGLERYNSYIRSNRIETKYIKQGGTWFHGQCWDDDYSVRNNNFADIPERSDTGNIIDELKNRNGNLI